MMRLWTSGLGCGSDNARPDPKRGRPAFPSKSPAAKTSSEVTKDAEEEEKDQGEDDEEAPEELVVLTPKLQPGGFVKIKRIFAPARGCSTTAA